MVTAQPTELHAVSVAIRITRLSNVEALGGGTVQPVAHPPQEGHRIDKDASAVTSQTKAEDEEEEEMPSRNLLPKGQAMALMALMNALTVTGLSGSQHPPKVDGPGGIETKESVSMYADLPKPAHPPKVSGEQFHNTFTCDALISNGNELYDPPSNKGKAYTDTDSDGKTEIITDITCNLKAS